MSLWRKPMDTRNQPNTPRQPQGLQPREAPEATYKNDDGPIYFETPENMRKREKLRR